MLQLDDLIIKNSQISGIVFDWDGTIQFYGLALDFEGKRICDRLSKFKLNHIVGVKIKWDGRSREAFFKLFEIEIPQEEIDGGHLLYRFSGKLSPLS